MLRTLSLLLASTVVVARNPMWLRHYNGSVAPARCGDINIEPLFPPGVSDETIQRYASNTVEDYSAYVLELGECGKIYSGYENLNHSWPIINMTKRNNPPSLRVPWFTHGNTPGGGLPGIPGTSSTFQILCESECSCSASGKTVYKQWCPTAGCPPCTDANCPAGRCMPCSPSFNKKLEGTMINLWCDPSDLDCKNGRPSRPVPTVVAVAVAVAVGAASSIDSDYGRFRLKSNTSVCLTDSLGFAACEDVAAQTWDGTGLRSASWLAVPSQQMCLGVRNATDGDLTMVGPPCTDEPAQMWTLTSEGQLLAHVSGCENKSSSRGEQLGAQAVGCCMEAKDNTVKLRSCDGSPNQIWTFDSAITSSITPQSLN